MNPVVENLAYLAAVILVPLIPACVIFLFLPSDAHAEGPFAGLKLKLGGAFAGYFILLLFSYNLLYQQLRPLRAQYWAVNGRLLFAQPSRPHPPPTGAQLMLRPPEPVIHLNGEFHLDVPITEHDATDGRVATLVAMVPGFEPVTVELDPDREHLANYNRDDYGITVDEAHHKIRIKRPIMLKESVDTPAATRIIPQPLQGAPPSTTASAQSIPN